MAFLPFGFFSGLLRLFRAEFDTAYATLPPPRAGWNMQDGRGALSVANGQLQVDGFGVARANPSLSRSVTRTQGQVFKTRVRIDSALQSHFFGFGSSLAGANAEEFVLTDVSGVLSLRIANAVTVIINNAFTIGTYDFAIVQRSAGALFFVKSVTGTAYPEWTLLWVSSTISVSPTLAYVGASSASLRGSLLMDYVEVAQAGSPFTLADDVATTAITGAISEGQTWTRDAINGQFIQTTLTTLHTSNSIQIVLRNVDANNRLWLNIGSNGAGAIYRRIAGVDDIVPGSSTAPGALTAGSLLTLIDTPNGDIIIYNGTTQVISVNVANHLAATVGEIASLGTGGVLTNLTVRPRVQSGAALAELNDPSGATVFRDDFNGETYALNAVYPGPGVLYPTDTTGRIAIYDGKYVVADRGTTNAGVVSQPFTPEAGLVLHSEVTASGALAAVGGHGIANTATLTTLLASASLLAATRHDGTTLREGSNTRTAPFTLGAERFISFDGSRTYFVDGATGKIAFVSDTTLATSSYLQTLSSANAGSYSHDYLRITKSLPAPFNTAYGLAAQRLPTVALNDTFQHPQEFFLEVTVTHSTGNPSVIIHFRRKDADNYWGLVVYNTGYVDLSERVAGINYVRAAMPTGSVASGGILRAFISGNTIRIWGGSNTAAYASASTLQDQTTLLVSQIGTGATITNLVVYNLNLTAPQLAILRDATSYTNILNAQFNADKPTWWNQEVGVLFPTQVDGTFDTAGGNLEWTTQSTPAYGDLGFTTRPFSATPGFAFLGEFANTTRQDSVFTLAYSANLLSTLANNFAGLYTTANTVRPILGGASIALTRPYTTGAVKFAIVLQPVPILLVNVAGTWELLWVFPSVSATVVYAQFQNYNCIGTGNYFRARRLTGSWAQDYGLAQTRIVSPANPQPFSHPVAAIGGLTITTLPSAGQVIDFIFRRTDPDNFFRIRINSGGTIVFQRVTLGVATDLGATIAFAAGTRIQFVVKDAVLWAFSGVTLIGSPTTTQGQTDTAGEVVVGTGGAVSDLVVWAVNVDTALTSQLEAV